MEQRYNIALLPHSKPQPFIDLAMQLYPIADTYRLGHMSMPHVTLCQFYAPHDHIEMLWQQASQHWLGSALLLDFANMDFFAGDASHWVFLRPNQLETLMALHCAVAAEMDCRIGRCFEEYDAHLTLINTVNPDYKVITQKIQFAPITTEFRLALGLADEYGQFQRVLKII